MLDEATSGLDPVVRSEMLDLFLEFIQDEEHSILLLQPRHQRPGKSGGLYHVHPRGKDRVQQNRRTISWSSTAWWNAKKRAPRPTDGAHILGRRDSKFDAELLVDNRPEAARLYPGMLTEQATIDDIMTFFAEGAYDA